MNFGRCFWLFDSLFPVFFLVVFVLVIGTFLYVLISGLVRFFKNQASPRLVVVAKVVSKRTEVRSGLGQTHHHRTSHYHHSHYHTFTRYFVTFELEDRERIELQVTGSDYGLIAQGDQGRLTYQGTRFQGFDRIQ